MASPLAAAGKPLEPQARPGFYARDNQKGRERPVMKRRDVLKTGVAAAATAAWLRPAAAQAAGDQVRPLTILSIPQANDPHAYQAAELIVDAFKQLGLDVNLRPLSTEEQAQIIWYERQRWDMGMWSMVGRPERSDPDELTYNLFVSANAPTGYDFVGYINPTYDTLAQQQRSELDQKKRKELIIQSQEMINHDQPYGYLVHPINLFALNTDVFDEKTTVTQPGIGIRNFWTFLSLTPKGDKKDIIVNSSVPSGNLSPFNIAGATGWWIADLVWDRLMRIGPDGLPREWAAQNVKRPTDTTVEFTLRPGMKWHDGKPVTVDDVIFSIETPGAPGDKAPMFKPFVQNIAKVEPNGDNGVKITLKRADAAFLSTTMSKLYIAPKHVWTPILANLQGKNAESVQEEHPVGSGPYRMVRFNLSEEAVLEANPDHWAKPKAARWIYRVIPNVEATLGALKAGEINFLADYTGDPQLLANLAKAMPALKIDKAVDIGMQFLAYNERRPPFNDVAFRQALSAAIDREEMANDAWGGAAVPANSHISPALVAWHDDGIEKKVPGGDGNIDGAKKILKDAGYVLVDGKLHYPAGVKESLKPYQ
jgi:peptide/nickel transport system substrate-binding protein